MVLGILASAVHAEVLPTPGATDARIRTAPYRADEVYPLVGQIGYQIDLEFAAGERFVGLAAGDVQGVSFEAQDNHLFLKPKAARVDTNLTVLTSLRRYYLQYRVRPDAKGAAHGPPLYALRFLYPDTAPSAAAVDALREQQRIAAALGTPAAVVNRNYWYCGAPALQPTSVTDDGVATRFTFGARSELPAIFVRAQDGSESLVNFTVTADGLTVHRLSPRFILRRGTLVGCVVNRGFNGGGERLATGTVAPSVERALPRKPDPLPAIERLP